MTDQPTIGIFAFKKLPDASSSNAQRIADESQRLHEAAKTHYVVIQRCSDLQDVISTSKMESCWDSLAAIRQIEAALSDVGAHFSGSLSHSSIEFAHNQVKELLRKSEKQIGLLASFVRR